MSTPASPDLSQEQRLWEAGYRAVAGVDEAGRGAWAGPVVAAAVILPPAATHAGVWSLVRDSKLLDPATREALAQHIRQAALAWAVASASPREIDRLGIAAATRLAMARAIQALTPTPDYLLVDWVHLDRITLPQERFVQGDRHIVSIAAASILAKVHRDRYMVRLHAAYPRYDFQRHKGYGTAAHQTALDRYGPSPVHRHSFAPIAQRTTLFDLPPMPEASVGHTDEPRLHLPSTDTSDLPAQE